MCGPDTAKVTTKATPERWLATDKKEKKGKECTTTVSSFRLLLRTISIYQHRDLMMSLVSLTTEVKRFTNKLQIKGSYFCSLKDAVLE